MNPGEDRDSGKKKKKLDSDQIKIKPEVFMVRGIFDVKSWMTPVREHLHGIIYPHYFKLFKGENGNVEMKYKNWCSDRWFPETDDGNPGSLVVLKANVILKGEPEQIFPSEEQQELPKLKKDIKQYFKSSTLFGEVVKEEWRNFLAPDSSHFKMNNIDWPLADIVKKKQQQKKKEEEKRQSTSNLSAQLFPDMPRPEGLSEVAETRVAAQRDPLPLVYTGPYQAGIHNAVAEVDDHLAKLAPGCMVAVLLANYNMDIPYLGQVLGVNGDEFEIHYWKGSYNKEWEPHMLRVREGKSWKTTPYTDTLPTTCVILCGFEFENNKLTKFHKQYLKEKLAEESRKRKRITLDSQGDQQGEHRNAKKPKQ